MRAGARLIVLVTAAAALLAAPTEAHYAWRLPPDVAPPPVPPDNPMSPAKVALGRRLFYDADLSIDGTVACATCHEQRRAFTDGNRTHGGVRGAEGRRNIMALANVGYLSPLTWADPATASLEQQVLVPLTGLHPVEMGMAGQEAVLAARLGKDRCYRRMFASAFPGAEGQIAFSTIAKAVAAFERTLLSFRSPYDRYRGGDRNAIPASAKRGAELFFGPRFQCGSCHSGDNFTDMRYHDLGFPPTGPDPGLGEKTHDPQDGGKFRTPGLRNVSWTGPYLHDGSAKDIAAAIGRHFIQAGDKGARPGDERTAADIGEGDIADLTAFLNSLNDRSFVFDPRFSLPKAACGKRL